MDWLNSIVKVEHPTLIPALLHSTLANYGEIDAFLPCNIEDSSTKRFFVRYSSPQAAQGAYNNQHTVRGLEVSMLCQDPRLLGQYLAACSLNRNKEHTDKLDAGERTLDAPEKDAYTPSKTRRRSRGRKSAKIQSKKYPDESSSASGAKERLSTSSLKVQKDILTQQPGAKASATSANLSAPKHITQYYCVKAVAPSPSSNASAKRPTQESVVKAVSPSLTPASLSTERPMQYFGNVNAPPFVCNGPCPTDEEYPKTSVQLISAPCYPPVVTVPATFCMATKMELRVAGERFIYDLNKLEDDPKSIIELLKLASAERAHWMTVGAFYRRRGKSHAAIKIMMELIEVLKNQSVDEDKMKPIYLMLSGCEADLAKTIKGQNSSCSIALMHYLSSQTWLQKVYGTFENPEQVVFNDGTGRPLVSTFCNNEWLENVKSRIATRASNVGEKCNKRRKLCTNCQID